MLLPHLLMQLVPAAAPSLVPPVALLALCVVAGIGTVLLLPGRREGAVRKVGGAVLLLAAVVFALLLARTAGGVGVYFWIFSAIALGGAVRVVTHPRPVYSALYFVLTVFASAGLFVLMAAEFMAAALVLIYAGAILITYVFVIMLAASTTGSRAADAVAEYDQVSREPIVASAVGFALMGVLLFVIFDKADGLVPAASAANPLPGTTQNIGYFLFRDQFVNLELGGLILTMAMVGAIVIAKRRVVSSEDSRDAQRRTPASPEASPITDDPKAIPVYGTDNPAQKAYPQT
ncbi:MAG TPA: NADH-quinone oxidoreductase subunit J [Tepidisphaeraceae bacterium]|nr:NADH-quinone oxidoreductase subunit J [Tepidisphaeraceae bacterium]